MNKKQVIISVNNLTKNYYKNKQEIKVIKNLSFSINKGEITTISGESGAGKSTLLYLLSGLLKPTNGEVLFENININMLSDFDKSRLINEKIGYVFQDFQLLSNLTVWENIFLPAKIYLANNGIKLDYKQKISALLEKFKLIHRVKHYPAELSGGEQQRVAIIRALINNPNVIFCDEPTGNLDSSNSDTLISTIIELKEKYNQTFVIVSHSAKFAGIADKVIYLKDGKIL